MTKPMQFVAASLLALGSFYALSATRAVAVHPATEHGNVVTVADGTDPMPACRNPKVCLP